MSGHCAGVSPLRNETRDCTQSKSRRRRSTGHSRQFARGNHKKDLYCLHPLVCHDVEKKADGSTLGLNGTQSWNCLGQAALRREQWEQLESNHHEN
jgi:hypothetical protein